MVGQAGVAQAADHEEPVGPVGIDEDIPVGTLDKEGSVPNPGQADLAVFGLGKNGGGSVAVAALPGKKGGQKHIRDKAVGALSSGRGAFRLQGAFRMSPVG